MESVSCRSAPYTLVVHGGRERSSLTSVSLRKRSFTTVGVRPGNIYRRSSYVSFENSLDDIDKNLVVVFEATTAKICFTNDVLRDIADENNKYSSSMKTLLHKLGQLERQVFYLSYYYSVNIHQIFAGLIFFELYRTPSIDPNQLLKNIMDSEVIGQYFPLLYQLFKIEQFIFTY